MEKVHTLEDFYLNSTDCLPENLRKDVGHFNVFKMEDYIGKPTKSVPYSRKDYYKISLIIGNNIYHYADKSIEIKSAGISFANPMIPYKIERIGESQRGYFCVFTEAFLNQIPNIKEYPIFKPGSFPIYNLDEEQIEEFRLIFEQMSAEINVDYAFKYDFLRALVQQVIHKAMRLAPNDNIQKHTHSANNRITSLFVELLERQFPIENTTQILQLKSPKQYADALNVHVNHLNKVLKETMGKTTGDIIASRINQEAKVLLKQTTWNVSEIAYSLGFEEIAHFSNFFKKKNKISPLVFRE